MNIGDHSAKSRAKRHMPWYKRCPVDWRAGTRSCSMTMELRGFYSECLDAMWELQGALPKDAKALAMLLGSNPRQVRALMAKLIDLGKMVETDNDFHNPRMLADIFRERENLESASTGAPIDRESTSKIRKNPTNSTRGLEADTEAEIDKKRIGTPVLVAARVADGPKPDEIHGLNGATAEIVNGVARMFNQLAPDLEWARKQVSSNVAIYGSEAVRDGYAELMADVADNKVRIPSHKALVGYFKTAKDRRDRGTAKAATGYQPKPGGVLELIQRREREGAVA
jgi:uncharacterized protein YdaU (DUF1376 family)